jgi:hypothetical protein
VPVSAKTIETGTIDAFPVGFNARAAGLYQVLISVSVPVVLNSSING